RIGRRGITAVPAAARWSQGGAMGQEPFSVFDSWPSSQPPARGPIVAATSSGPPRRPNPHHSPSRPNGSRLARRRLLRLNLSRYRPVDPARPLLGKVEILSTSLSHGVIHVGTLELYEWTAYIAVGAPPGRDSGRIRGGDQTTTVNGSGIDHENTKGREHE